MALRGYEPDDLLPIGDGVYVLENDITTSCEVVEELDELLGVKRALLLDLLWFRRALEVGVRSQASQTLRCVRP